MLIFPSRDRVHEQCDRTGQRLVYAGQHGTECPRPHRCRYGPRSAGRRSGIGEVSLSYGGKPALKDISFSLSPVPARPSSAHGRGQDQLLYLLTGLIKPGSGIRVWGQRYRQLRERKLYRQLGFVFQDSIIFNMSIRENIAFSDTGDGRSLELAIATSELSDFVNSLPEGLNTIVSERGSSLSGGQKQRIMLAVRLPSIPGSYCWMTLPRGWMPAPKKDPGDVQKNYPGIPAGP